MNQLETLLNSLIQMGWKPWGKDAIKMSKQCPDRETGVIYIHFTGEERGYRHIRQLVSLESGLWRFVCENNLYKKEANNFRENVSKVGNNIGGFNHNYQYRLIESALIPEEELVEFLVDNIKIEGITN